MTYLMLLTKGYSRSMEQIYKAINLQKCTLQKNFNLYVKDNNITFNLTCSK